MEPQFKTSFIPKQSLAKAGKKIRGGPHIAVVPFIALVIFLGALGLAVGIFLYEKFLTRALDSKKEQLEQARESLRSPLIDELSRLDARIKSSEEILDSHLILTAFFDLLEKQTLTNVRFADFSYEISEGGIIEIAMKGTARSFNTIAVQSEVFNKDRYIRNPVFSGLTIGEDGTVGFNFTASVDARLLSYRLSLEDLENNQGGDDDGE